MKSLVAQRLCAGLLAGGLLFTAGCGESGYTTTTQLSSQAIATLSASALAFGNSPVGMTSATQSVTLTNTGGPMAFNGVSVTGTNASSFLTSTTCVTPVAKNASCTVSVAFAPTATGPLSGTLLISDSAVGSPQSVTLTGTGTATGPVVSLSATTLTFTSLPVGQASTQTVTLSNIGNAALSLNGFTLGGANASSFALSGSCLTTGVIAAGFNCFLTVTYAPTITGSLNAVVNVNDSAPNTPQIITLASH